MSNSAAVAPLPSASLPLGLLPADPVDGLLDRLANYLVPLFVTDAEGMGAARLMAVRTIAAYQPETQADLINIGRTIAFSMSALAVLGRVASEDMPPALHLRYLARANVLNREADQSERSMERRRRHQNSITPSLETAGLAAAPSDGAAEPDLASDEAAIEAAVAEAIRDFTASRRPAAPRAPTDLPAEATSVVAAMPDAVRVSADPIGPVRRPAWPPRTTPARGGGPMSESVLRPGGGPDRASAMLLRPPDRSAAPR